MGEWGWKSGKQWLNVMMKSSVLKSKFYIYMVSLCYLVQSDENFKSIYEKWYIVEGNA